MGKLNKVFYADVYDCNSNYIVLAKTKKEAFDKVWKRLNEDYPKAELINRGCIPYKRTDIKLSDITEECETDCYSVYV